MSEDTKKKVQRVVDMIHRIAPDHLVDGGYCGPRGRVIYGTSQGPVRITVKLWIGLDHNRRFDNYQVHFSMEFTAEATETQVVDAMEALNKFRNNCPTFESEEYRAVYAALDEIVGKI